MKEYEHKLQVECIKWFRLQYPKLVIFAIPNGGDRNIIVAQKLKAEGVVAGVPDLFIPYPSNVYHGLFIEMKYGKKGRVSEAQKYMLEKLELLGYKCCVVRCFDDFYNQVTNYIK